MSTAAVYVLIPQAGGYETYAAFALADLHAARATRGGQGLQLSVRGRRGDQVGCTCPNLRGIPVLLGALCGFGPACAVS